MKNLLPLLSISLLAGLFACKDQPEQIPAYLNIQPFTVNAQGDATWHELTEGWLYVNGEYLGAYTLPATVPVLAEGATEILVFPGVKQNGILASPNIYPLLTRWEASSVNLVAGQTTEVQPSTAYDPGIKFPFGIGRGDFDLGSSIVLENRDDDQATTFSLSTNGAFAGKSILIEVDTAHPVIEFATEPVNGIPVSGLPEVWLEMHYKCDMPFSLYLLYSSNGSAETPQLIYDFNESDSWNKIYFNLTPSLQYSQAGTYRLFFQAQLPYDEQGKFSQLNGTVRIDNLRLAHL